MEPVPPWPAPSATAAGPLSGLVVVSLERAVADGPAVDVEQLRTQTRELCAGFPDEYWREPTTSSSPGTTRHACTTPTFCPAR